jgi:hypothetical protein
MNGPKTCLRYVGRYIRLRKNSKNYSKPFEANSKTTFDYFSPEIDRKQAEDMSDYISAPGKLSKNYSKPFESNSETNFDYHSPEIDR